MSLLSLKIKDEKGNLKYMNSMLLYHFGFVKYIRTSTKESKHVKEGIMHKNIQLQREHVAPLIGISFDSQERLG